MSVVLSQAGGMSDMLARRRTRIKVSSIKHSVIFYRQIIQFLNYLGCCKDKVIKRDRYSPQKGNICVFSCVLFKSFKLSLDLSYPCLHLCVDQHFENLFCSLLWKKVVLKNNDQQSRHKLELQASSIYRLFCMKFL